MLQENAFYKPSGGSNSLRPGTPPQLKFCFLTRMHDTRLRCLTLVVKNCVESEFTRKNIQTPHPEPQILRKRFVDMFACFTYLS